MLTQFGQSLLVQWFREVFGVVRRYLASDTPFTSAPEYLQRQLILQIEGYDRQATRIGGNFLEAYGDARYAIVALADELLINEPWQYRQWWQHNLLEEAVHGTYVAGEEFFRRAERILTERRTMEYREVARVYLLCMQLGFRGQYRGARSNGAIEHLSARLYEYITDQPYLAGTVTTSLSDIENSYVFSSETVRYFAPSYRRYLILAALIGGWVLVSLVLWFTMTVPLRRIAAEIEQSPPLVLTSIERSPHRTYAELVFSIQAPYGETGVLHLYDDRQWDMLNDTIVRLGKEIRLRLPSYRRIIGLCEAPACYPVVDTFSTDDTTIVRRRYTLDPLRTFANRPILLEPVSFEPGSAELNLRSVPWLNALARALASDTTLRITVYGYTDARGNPQTNMRLSRMRAEQVVTYLLQHGVSYERMQAVGMGALNPRASNTTEEGRSQNRRVELLIMPR